MVKSLFTIVCLAGGLSTASLAQSDAFGTHGPVSSIDSTIQMNKAHSGVEAEPKMSTIGEVQRDGNAPANGNEGKMSPVGAAVMPKKE